MTDLSCDRERGILLRESMDQVPAYGLFRCYRDHELQLDGYPLEWKVVKHIVRAKADDRCVRCGHPYRVGQHSMETKEIAGSVQYVSWSPCDASCVHGGPARVREARFPGAPWQEVDLSTIGQSAAEARLDEGPLGLMVRYDVEAAWRILTVHHLNGDKSDLRWWNLASLCQRCHLTIQGKVHMDRPWPHPHSDWFKPYAAGWYAERYLGEALTREQVDERIDELLDLERWPSLF